MKWCELLAFDIRKDWLSQNEEDVDELTSLLPATGAGQVGLMNWNWWSNSVR